MVLRGLGTVARYERPTGYMILLHMEVVESVGDPRDIGKAKSAEVGVLAEAGLEQAVTIHEAGDSYRGCWVGVDYFGTADNREENCG